MLPLSSIWMPPSDAAVCLIVVYQYHALFAGKLLDRAQIGGPLSSLRDNQLLDTPILKAAGKQNIMTYSSC